MIISTRQCKCCNTNIEHLSIQASYCSSRCFTRYRNEKKFDDLKEDYDFIKCPDCGQKMADINLQHVKMHGFETIQDFKNKHNLQYVQCEKKRERMIGDKNPGYQHGGKLSPWSTKSNFTAEEIKESKDLANENSHQPEKMKTRIEYWIKEGYSEEEAKQKVKERQTTNSVEAMIKRGMTEEEAIANRLEITTKWQKSLKESGMYSGKSTIATELFSSVAEEVDNLLYDDNELIVVNENRLYQIDCAVDGNMNIIEFFGDYWHAKPTIYDADKVIRKHDDPSKQLTASDIWIRDAQRIKELESMGYNVKIVWEQDYRKDKVMTTFECVMFLLEEMSA